MQVKLYPTFHSATYKLGEALLDWGYEVTTEKWQGMDNATNFLELLNVSFSVPMVSKDSLRPNQPWADEHFKERISGKPLNPGESYKIWPFYGMDAKMRTEEEQFTHTYMERFWPRHAGLVTQWKLKKMDGLEWHHITEGLEVPPHRGIRYEYGDLQSVVNLLKREPFTRQAYLPVWFPEDTGAIHGGRVPCTLGYHFILRNDHLFCIYYLRSCDFLRHLQDDMYLAVKLCEGLLEVLKETNPVTWEDVQLGTLTMHITSLHVFAQERLKLKKLYGTSTRKD